MEQILHRADFLKRGVNKNGRKYSAWTKDGVRAWVRYVLHHPEAMEEVHIHTSDKNIKLSALMFSTPPGPATEENFHLGTCANLPCVNICYAIKTEKFRPSAMIANMENALMLKFALERAIMEFGGDLRKYEIRCTKAGVAVMVRWHEAGEFTPEDSALLDAIAEMFPTVRFYGYTKLEEYYIKYYNHPNVNILWSAWRGMEIPAGVLACGRLKAFFVEFADGKNEYMAEHVEKAKAEKRYRRCPGLINGEFACNKCKFTCSGCYIVVAKEH